MLISCLSRSHSLITNKNFVSVLVSIPSLLTKIVILRGTYSTTQKFFRRQNKKPPPSRLVNVAGDHNATATRHKIYYLLFRNEAEGFWWWP